MSGRRAVFTYTRKIGASGQLSLHTIGTDTFKTDIEDFDYVDSQVPHPTHDASAPSQSLMKP